jgi:ABC-2 type transport system ATP-binding protein/lipopolysaccharide transport system ATP-binding protein
MKDKAVVFENVEKYFLYTHQKTLKEMIQAIFKKRKTVEQVHALKNINFTIDKGETVGVIGRNGAGKSTLLKLIAGVSQPTTGKVQVNGRVVPLIELGAGFHPELTGRENIFLNGVILGLSENEIKEKINQIIEFSEIEKFIDTPVKFYSSGMYMRLAFSVSVFVNPDILLVDEILAVGDNQFQKKCLAKMEEFKKNGVTIVFVSHSLETIKQFCRRVIYLKTGKIVADGKSQQVIDYFLKNEGQ